MDIGREIRRLREEKGWSQAMLAGAARMGVSGVSQIETGARNPSAVTLAKIAEALNVEVADLFPKAQARLPLERSLDDVLEDLQHTTGRFQSYHEIQKAMDDYRELWEKRLAGEDFDKAAIEEASRALSAFWPAVTAAADAEMYEFKRLGAELEVAKAESVLLPAIARFQALSERVDSAYREKFRDEPASKVRPLFPQRKAS